MDGTLIAGVLTGLALAVAVAGTIIPVLPGSVLGILALLGWAIFGGAGSLGWVVFGIGGALFAAGLSASAVLTGRRLRQREIPSRSVLVGIGLGVVGMFVIPVVGLFVGFAAGLLLSEWQRTREFRTAASSAWAALKATGLGMLVEFGFAAAAATAWVIGLWIHVLA